MLRYYLSLAVRALRRTPIMAMLMILTLAVGFAAGMTTNTLRYVLALDPVPGKSARLLNLQDPTVAFHLGGIFDYAKSRVLSRIGTRYADATITGWGAVGWGSGPDQPKDIPLYGELRYATASFFHMFSVPLKHGRIWTHAEADSAAPVVVISDRWASKLFPNGNAIGKQVRLGEALYTVIGVSGPWNPRPRYYDLASPAGAFGGTGPGAFVPLTAVLNAPDDAYVYRGCKAQAAPPSQLLSSDCSWLHVWYLAHSQRDARLLTQSVRALLPDLFPPERAGGLQVLSVQQLLAKADLVPGSVRLYAVLGLAFLALCVINAAGMQLSRVLRSRPQIGIRRALGASRVDIIRQYLFDAMLVGVIGGCGGVGLTFGALYAVRVNLPTSYASMAHMDGPLLGALIVLILVCSGLVGVVPAWVASRADPALLIKAAQ